MKRMTIRYHFEMDGGVVELENVDPKTTVGELEGMVTEQALHEAQFTYRGAKPRIVWDNVAVKWQ